MSADTRQTLPPARFDPTTQQLYVDGQYVPLEPQPRLGLALLYSRRRQLVTRLELARGLWPSDPGISEETLQQYTGGIQQAIYRLRQALGERVQNVRGQGYILHWPDESAGEDDLRREQPKPEQPAGRISNLAERHARPATFTGRVALLEELEKALRSGEPATLTQAVTGLGGVGKTWLAAEYAYRHEHEYDVVWWVRAEEPATLASDYAALATALGLVGAEERDEAVAATAARRWLDGHVGWLLVLDNVERPEAATRYFPRARRGHVLITSRWHDWSSHARLLSVKVFDEDEAVRLLLDRTGQRDEAAAAILAKTLGYLPMALAQAAAFMARHGTPMGEYLRLFEKRRPELARREAEVYGEHATVDATFGIAIGRMRREAPAAADLLLLCAFLAPEGIPLSLIAAGAEHLPKRLAGVAGDPLSLNAAVAVLLGYALMERSEDALSVHRLVQMVARDRLSQREHRNWALSALRLINEAFPTDGDDTRTWDTGASLLPHALATTNVSDSVISSSSEAGRLLNQAGIYLRIRGRFAEARSCLERSVSIAEAIYGPDEPNVAHRLANLGSLLADLGDYASARLVFERALPILENTYGSVHPAVSTVLNNLGIVFFKLGDLQRARGMLLRAIRIDQAAFGNQDPLVARDLCNLGNVFYDLGDLRRAYTAYEQALRIDEAAYGSNDPKIAIRLNNIGRVMRALGDLVRAREAHERALRIDEAAYGPEHPTIAIAACNLGTVLLDQGDTRLARMEFERALGVSERFLGAEHPITRLVRENMELLNRIDGRQ